MKTIPGKICVFIMACVVLVHVIPMTFCFSRHADSWFSRPLSAQDLPSTASQHPPPTHSQESPEIVLETIRGGRHKDYASIVFQFSKGIAFSGPFLKDDALHLLLPNVSTDLPSFRSYKHFKSSVTLEPLEAGLAVRIGLPDGYISARAFMMEAPHRLVVNIYDKPGATRTKAPIPARPRLRVSRPAQSGSLTDAGQNASITLNKTQFINNDADQSGLRENFPEGEGIGAPPVAQGPGKGGGGAGGGMTGHGSGAGLGSAGGGISSPSKRYRIRITPKISIKAEYDDNIFLLKNNKEGDFITTVSPGLLMSIDSGKTGLELEYTFGWVKYRDFSENDFIRHNGRLKFWQRLTRRLTFNLSDSYLKSNDLFDEDLDPDLRSQRIRHTATPYQRNDFDMSLDYRLGPQSRVSVGYRHALLDNEDPALEDVTEHSPYTKLSYWFNKKDGVELGYKYRRFDYSSGDDFFLDRVDLDAHDVDIAYMHRFGRRATIRVRYGFANRNFKGIPVSYHIHDGAIGFEYGFSPSMSLALEVGYFSPTGIDIDPGLEYTGRFEKRFRRGRAFISARSGWDEGFMDVQPRAFTRYWGGDAGIEYEPIQNFQAYAGVDYRKNDYALEEEEDDDTVGGRCGVRYRFLRWFSADLGYAHRRRTSDDPNNAYGDNRFTLTITASKPHPYHWEF